jgi:HEAT repeat protein
MSYDRTTGDATFLYELQRDGETSKLVSYLKLGEKPVVRRRAAEILGDFDDLQQDHEQEAVVQGLITTVKEDDDASVRARAIDALYRHGQDTLERLVTELSGFDVRDTPDWVTARTLADWLDAEYPEFRMVAAAAIGEVGGESEVPELVAAFDDPDARVQRRAIEACGIIGAPRCVEDVGEMLTDPNPLVRQAAARALGNVGTQEALEALVPVARADSETLRRIAVGELGKLTDPRAVIVLVKCVEDDTDTVQRTAVLSLVRLLSQVNEDETERVRQLVANQLESADTAAVVPELVDIVTERGQLDARRNAVWLLGRLVNEYREDVADALVGLLDHEDERTAHFATRGLAAIGGDELAKRLRIFVQNEDGSPEAMDRARFALREMDATPTGELVTNSVEYTYVRDPADYTAKKRGDEDGGG